ncbi:MAG: hypothetical protein HYY96_03070 [Candidatus Tectomicrobia bacterium]|nr:hypothetical protein [Candidatus Tectomicrobia bacterium]
MNQFMVFLEPENYGALRRIAASYRQPLSLQCVRGTYVLQRFLDQYEDRQRILKLAEDKQK